jgi:hypothetical protein
VAQTSHFCYLRVTQQLIALRRRVMTRGNFRRSAHHLQKPSHGQPINTSTVGLGAIPNCIQPPCHSLSPKSISEAAHDYIDFEKFRRNRLFLAKISAFLKVGKSFGDKKCFGRCFCIRPMDSLIFK